MAGSGDFSEIGWIHAINAAQGVTNGITQATAAQNGPPGDLLGTSTGTLTIDTATTTITCSGGIAKAIPSGAVLAIVDTSGATNTWDICTTSSAYASGTTTAMNVASFRPHITHATPLVYLIATNNYVALCSTTPTATAIGTELTTSILGAYARQLPVWTPSPATAPVVSANSGTITFGPFTSGTFATAVTAGMLMDSLATTAVAANMLAFYVWGTSKTPGLNDSLQITSAQLSLSSS
jgi:hypothetical protein